VISFIGVMLAVIIPQGQRAQYEAKISLVRQNASEAGSYVVAWAQKQAKALPNDQSISIENFLTGTSSDLVSRNLESSLINHYTGNPSFYGVKSLIHQDAPIRNPFNQISIFDRLNDDSQIPGKQPGLLFLISTPMGAKIQYNDSMNNLYFIYTGTDSKWYGSKDAISETGIRRGIFVARFSNLNATSAPYEEEAIPVPSE
jgi:hypothetical protein